MGLRGKLTHGPAQGLAGVTVEQQFTFHSVTTRSDYNR
jgi:hypothetical protein